MDRVGLSDETSVDLRMSSKYSSDQKETLNVQPLTQGEITEIGWS